MTSARVTVAGEVVGEIGPGLCVLVGVAHVDTAEVAERLADQVWHLRVLVGERSLADLGPPAAAALVVSQFTLYGDTRRGRRPSWSGAARPEQAEPLVERFCAALQERGAAVATGRFGAAMQVALVNDGPFTVMLER